ncbi:cobalt-precorrin-5B (C(1))-methyltransferase [Shewanella benthica]|uniref:Cobalt-precorrin-5B C(1)-methyltransferase n=1 Tax=Shewanella benthica KT99 TaxID=314608 RepID=A9D3E9_9GAMM|nr:cobalt-precorrin-5B (C(1))-methyltransferase [Shewanella benthica]EDQ01676.1 cobalt-precorrin-6A synthase [Shewanella benthica KT99]
MSVTRIRRSRNRAELRKGYTTGACATAAAVAAVTQLLEPTKSTQIEILLPIGQRVSFDVSHLPVNDDLTAVASVIKDAGDDPDCTHGAEIIAKVTLTHSAGIHFFAGEGVATVTLPGLELNVGEPAINPVPRQMICSHLLPLLAEHDWDGADVTISIPGGEELAKQTIGQRLGLIGGLSILGTRGTVHPYSTSAYAASVRQGVEVAKRQGLSQLILTTGSRTEKQAMILHPQLADIAFIQVGDFMGVGLRASVRKGIARVELVLMIGKLCKLVCGTMMTHVTGRAVDFAAIAHCLDGTDAEFTEKVSQANTGRHLLSLLPVKLFPDFYQNLCLKAAQNCAAYSHHKLPVRVRLIDYDGATLALANYGDI